MVDQPPAPRRDLVRLPRVERLTGSRRLDGRHEPVVGQVAGELTGSAAVAVAGPVAIREEMERGAGCRRLAEGGEEVEDRPRVTVGNLPESAVGGVRVGVPGGWLED